MIDTVQVRFPGNSKRYTYLSREPANIGDYAVVDSPFSGMITVPVVGVGGVEYTGSMKFVEHILTPAAALSSTKFQPPIDWKKEKYCLVHESGDAASGQKWHDTIEEATTQAQELIRATLGYFNMGRKTA